MSDFLPVSKKDLEKKGITQPDIICVSGDAYVDHPSFGIAIISRVIEAEGYSVAIIPQPDWHNSEDIKRFGKPRLGFLSPPAILIPWWRTILLQSGNDRMMPIHREEKRENVLTAR